MIVIASAWGLIAIRIFAATMTAPLLSHKTVGIWVRGWLAISIALVTIPVLGWDVPTLTLSQWIESALREAFIGAAMGFGMMLLFRSAAMAGSVVGQLAGIQLFESADGGTEHSPMSRYFSIVSIAVFVCLGGAESVVSGVLDSFVAIPISSDIATGNLVALMIDVSRQSFLLVLKCIVPAAAAMLIASYVIGILNRSFPGLNSMGIGLTSNLAVITLAVFLTLGGTMWLVMSDLQNASQWLTHLMRALPG